MNMLRKYIAPDGLMSLKPDAFLPGYNGYPKKTCDNDNGILFLVEHLLLNVEANDPQRYLEVTVQLLSKYPGLFFRNAMRDNYINSHDNLCALSTWGIYCNSTIAMKDLVERFPIINDEKPGVIFSNPHRPSGLHQGHNWFLYYLAAGVTPNKYLHWILTAWFCLNLFYASFWYRPAKHQGEILLSWVRVKGVEREIERLSMPKQLLVAFFIGMFKMKVKAIGGIGKIFALYFDKYHPNRIDSKGLSF